MLEYLRTGKKCATDLTKQTWTMAGLTAVQKWTWWWFPRCFWKHGPQSMLPTQPSHSPLVSSVVSVANVSFELTNLLSEQTDSFLSQFSWAQSQACQLGVELPQLTLESSVNNAVSVRAGRYCCWRLSERDSWFIRCKQTTCIIQWTTTFSGLYLNNLKRKYQMQVALWVDIRRCCYYAGGKNDSCAQHKS